MYYYLPTYQKKEERQSGRAITDFVMAQKRMKNDACFPERVRE